MIIESTNLIINYISPNTIIAATNTTSTNNWITEYFPFTHDATRNSNNKNDSEKQKDSIHRRIISSVSKNFAAISITSDNNIPILYNFIIKNFIQSKFTLRNLNTDSQTR